MEPDDDEYHAIDPEEPLLLPITDVFDLHTVPPRDVRAIVEEYLIEARAKGFRHIRLVHGKGIGVQRETVRKILERSDFVIEFGDAPAEAGGWGATVVTLAPPDATSADERT